MTAAQTHSNGGGTWLTAMKYIVGRKRAEESLGFLAAVSRAMASSLDYEQMVAETAALTVPFLADWCSVELLDGSGPARRLAAAAAYVEEETVAQLDRNPRPDSAREAEAATQLFLSARSVPDGAGGSLPPAGHRPMPESFSRLGVAEMMIVPIMMRGEALGSMSRAALECGRRRTDGPAEAALAEEVARRLACGIEIGRLHERLRAVTAAPTPR